jgi:hypothetical protein
VSMVAFVHSEGVVGHILVAAIGFEFDSVSEPDPVFGTVFRSLITLFGGGEVHAHFSDLAMTGNGGVFTRAGIEPWGDLGIPVRFLRGSVTVVRSTFRDMLSAVNTQAFAGDLVIGGTEDDGNVAEGVNSLIFTHDFDGSTIDVSYNDVHLNGNPFFDSGIDISNGIGAIIFDGFTVMPEAPSTIWVHNNRIKHQEGDPEEMVAAILVQDHFSRVGIGPRLSGRIEANSISGTGFNPVLTASTENIEIIDNYVTGNWVFGINPYLVSDGCTITGNVLGETKDGQKLGMSSLFGAISVEHTNNCNVSGNRFVNVSSPLLGAVWVSGQFNRVENNDYLESGLPGWNAGPGAIMLANFTGSAFNRDSKKNHVFENQYPVGTNVCEQIQGIQGNNVQAFVGGTVAGLNPGMCSAVLSLEMFNQSNAGLLQQMAEMQDRREEAWTMSKGPQ